ncbi:MAG: cation:proton antiporter [Methanomassiliicoccus sp.]|nr:cation:proton antiporter [Methanomassiliicoccus sp.]
MAGIEAAGIFIIGGLAIVTGYFANLLFRRYKAPDILILMFLGWIIGRWALSSAGVEVTDLVNSLIPFVSLFALSIIMFNGGLELSLIDIGVAGRDAVFLALSMFALVVLVLTMLFFLMGIPIEMAALCGVVFGSTSAPTVIPLISSLRCSTRIRAVLILESAITDVLVVGIGSAIVIYMATPGTEPLDSLLSMLKSVATSLIIGSVIGVLWINCVPKLKKYRYFYILTLAMIMLIFGACEYVAPSGGSVIAVLMFGLILGNAHHMPKFLCHSPEKDLLGEKFNVLNEEVSFFIKVFFFTFLGMYVATLQIGLELLIYGTTVFFILVILRQLVVALFKMRNNWARSELLSIRTMFPRGLCTIVVALLPFSHGVADGIAKDTLMGIVAFVVIASTILTSAGAYLVERQLAREDVQKNEESPSPPLLLDL